MMKYDVFERERETQREIIREIRRLNEGNKKKLQNLKNKNIFKKIVIIIKISK
jgi:hypothetical protein